MNAAALLEKFVDILVRYANVPGREAAVLAAGIDELKPYDTEAELLADAPDDGAIGYATDTGAFWFRRSGAWTAAASPASSNVAAATIEPFSIFVDYANPLAVDPPYGAVLASAADVTAALGGAPAFKHLTAVYAALPATIAHYIVINLATGIHRPHADASSFFAFDFSKKQITPSGQISLGGTSPSDWPAIVAAQTVTAHQTGSNDPYIDVAGTPFTGLDLKGRYAVLSSGQVAMIHEHTASRLRFCQAIAPALTNGVSTVTVAAPGTILRNSRDDVSSHGFFTMAIDAAKATADGDAGKFKAAYITIDPWDSYNGLTVLRGAQVSLTGVVLDYVTSRDAFAFVTDGQAFVAEEGAVVVLNNCSLYDTPPTSASWLDEIVSASRASLFLIGCYLRGSENGLLLDGSQVALYSTVVDGVGYAATGETIPGWVVATNGTRLLPLWTGPAAKLNEIRNSPGSRPALYLERGMSPYSFGTEIDSAAAALIFKSCGGPCVRLGPYGAFDVRGSVGFVNGGGNADVGFDVVGPHALALIDAATNVAGALGDTRIDGSIVAYASLGTKAAPTISARLNAIGKG